MIKISNISAPLDYDDSWLLSYVSKTLKTKSSDIESISLYRKSVDARKKENVHFCLTLIISIKNEAYILKKNHNANICLYKEYKYELPKPSITEFDNLKRPVIAGFGPAGIFTALILAECGLKPIVLERGFDVDTRKEKVYEFWENRKLDTECNVQFGEGGAGTFSDGKLTTGIKDSRARKVLLEFVRFGAPDEILYLAKPHIGTDILARVVKSIREHIISLGGQVIFGAKMTDFKVSGNHVSRVIYMKDEKENSIETNQLVLATGHSARDVFYKLKEKSVQLSRKNFAVGVRIEHKQKEINKALYGKFYQHKALKNADYKYVSHLKNGRSVYTFCMCPGGAVVAAASEKDTVVTNGMSYFARDLENANSALLVGINPTDFNGDDPLAGVEFQRKIERDAFVSGGSNYNAPIILVSDFLEHRNSEKIGSVTPSYKPDTAFAQPEEYLPDFVCESIRSGISEIGKKNEAFKNPDGIITGVESRSSSPVRIDRTELCESVSVKGLFPCGEGAGYAGGIVSAAVDGIRIAENIIKNCY